MHWAYPIIWKLMDMGVLPALVNESGFRLSVAGILRSKDLVTGEPGLRL